MRNGAKAAWLCVVALFFFVAAVVILPTVARAAEAREGAPWLTLKQSIEIALEHNLDIRVAREEIRAAQERREEAKTGFLPSLSGRYSYRRLSEVPYAVFGGAQIDFADQDQYRFTGTIQQPLFTEFATLSNYELAKMGLDVAKIQLARARFDLTL